MTTFFCRSQAQIRSDTAYSPFTVLSLKGGLGLWQIGLQAKPVKSHLLIHTGSYAAHRANDANLQCKFAQNARPLAVLAKISYMGGQELC